MTEIMDGQVSWFDQDICYGKTCPEHSQATKAQTSLPSLKKRSASSSRKPPLFLCLRKDGQQADVSTPMWEHGALLGAYSMHSFGECPKEENESRLSSILEECPHPKYSLSARACEGILRRMNAKNKPLPECLRETLVWQAGLVDDRPRERESGGLRHDPCLRCDKGLWDGCTDYAEQNGNRRKSSSACFAIDRAAFNQGINAQYAPQIECVKSSTLVSKGANAVGVIKL